MKSLYKAYQMTLCNHCDKPLSLEEMAFNETLCNKCQHEINDLNAKNLATAMDIYFENERNKKQAI